VTPPRLSRFVEAEAPAEHEGATESVAVLLELTVDETGRVSGARVVESASDAYDHAALAAARQFEFEPARRGAVSVAARVTYRYVFPGEPAAQAAGRDAPRPAPPPSTQESPPSPAPPESSSSVVAGEPAAASGEELSFGATAEIEAPPRETTKRVVERDKLTRIPGTGGDAVRAVEVMPGVARTSISWGVPILRGAAWHESTSYIDGVPVPLLYHFGGVKSTFNSHLFQQV
jgi:TonB family protein